MLRKTRLVLVAAAMVSTGSVTGAAAFGGGGFGGAGVSYPANFGSDYTDHGGCHFAMQRVMTRHGWRVRRVQVC
jgi:hypothetical protein